MKKGNGKINNFMNWADTRYGHAKEEKSNSIPLTSHSPPLPQPTITYDIRNNRIYPESQMYSQPNEISQAQMRITKAREENLALKRLIAQKNIQNTTPSVSTSPQIQDKRPTDSFLHHSHVSSTLQVPSEANNKSNTEGNQKNRPHEHTNNQNRSPTESNVLHPNISRPTSNHSPTPITSPSLPVVESDFPPRPKKTSRKSEKRKLQREKEKEQRTLLEQSITDLKRFSEHLDAAIDDNKKLLAGDIPVLDSKLNQIDKKNAEADREKKKKMKLEEKQRRQRMKLQMDSLLQGQNLNILPRWRHRLRGNMNPKPEEILKGKGLFRVAYYLVMHFYVKPRLSIRNRKAQTKSSEMDSLLKSLLLFIDNTSHWLGKLVKTPISSIIQVFCLPLYSHTP